MPPHEEKKTQDTAGVSMEKVIAGNDEANPSSIEKDQDGKSSSTRDSAEATAEELALKRAANRLASRNCRRRQKLLIEQLRRENSLLRAERTTIRLKIEACLAENKRLMMMHEKEQQRVMQRSRVLHAILRQQVQELQDQVHLIPPQSAMTASALLELASGTSRNTPELVPTPSNSLPRADFQVSSPVRRELPVPSKPVNRESLIDLSHDVLRAQSEVLRLREEVKGVRAFLARQALGNR